VPLMMVCATNSVFWSLLVILSFSFMLVQFRRYIGKYNKKNLPVIREVFAKEETGIR
jgi:hypothetical protein